MTTKVLCAQDIEVCYHTREGVLPALRNINFEVNRGEIVGVVGESGCGKSTLAYTVNQLLPPNAEITKGRSYFRVKICWPKTPKDAGLLGKRSVHDFPGS
jgi:ABC-type glutathione transport system ATPase component